MARQARSSGVTVLVDTLETELRILELQKRLAAQLQVCSAHRLCASWPACGHARSCSLSPLNATSDCSYAKSA